MAQLKKKKGPENKSTTRERIQLAAIGMEAEFAVIMDGVQVKPEDIFGSPRKIIREKMMHRKGRSYHLPTGGAVYFDTGVIEVATPVIEIERGCAARAGRSLWEAILFVRQELDAWEQAHDTDVQLAGFSTHYNISFELPRSEQGPTRTIDQLSYLLAHILPIPVMVLAANRRSTGIGVRPRGDRIEVTADFTPDAPLMIATATLIVGIVREVMRWPSYEISALEDTDIPIIRGFHPMPHTTRKGWLARFDCFPENPFIADIDTDKWPTTDGRFLSLREMAGRITKHFWPFIRRYSDPFTLRLIGSVMKGRAPSLLDLDDRPAGYEDVGRLCTWHNLFAQRVLPRSQYERVLIRAINGDKRHIFSLDYLLDHLREWERPYRTGKRDAGTGKRSSGRRKRETGSEAW